MPLIAEIMDIVSAQSIRSGVHSPGGGAEMLIRPSRYETTTRRERPNRLQRSVSQPGSGIRVLDDYRFASRMPLTKYL
jgi:hypothetical protein